MSVAPQYQQDCNALCTAAQSARAAPMDVYPWLDEGSYEMDETGTHKSNNASAGVTQVEVMVEVGGHEINTDTPSVTVHSPNTLKTEVTGQKRNRYYNTV